MDYRLDEIDRRILYHLVNDARNTSAPMIAEEVNVSPGTIRNRIEQLEDHGVITGYHANIDYERADGRLTNQYECTTDVPNRERLAQQALEISGVVNVQELLTGRGNLRVTAVGEDMRDLSRIANELSGLGIDVVDEDLLHREHTRPYAPFGPEDHADVPSITDFMSVSGGAEIATLRVNADARIAGTTLQEANAAGLIDEELLIVSIERDDAMLTPRGSTTIHPDDLVTIFSRVGIDERTLTVFKS